MRGLRALVLVVCGMLGGGLCGCERDAALVESRGGASSDAQTEGHAFLAQLLPCHPLYANLAQLDSTIRKLRAPEADQPPPQSAWQDAWMLTAPGLIPYPRDSYPRRRQETVARDQPTAPGVGEELPRDIAQSLAWQRLQIERALAGDVLELYSAASMDLAQATVELYRKNLERLTSQTAAESPEAVREALERKVGELRKAQEERVAATEAALRQGAQARLEEAEAAARRRAAERRRPHTSVVEQELGSALTEELRDFELPEWIASLRPPDVNMAMPSLMDQEAYAQARARAEEEWRQARERHAQLLARRQAEIARQMLDATRLAAERVARRQGWRLHLVPDEPATGPDLTAQVAAEISRMWGTEAQ